MSGNSFVLDTNIISLYLKGDRKLLPYFNYTIIHVSFITELELLTGKAYTLAQSKLINITIKKCHVYNYDNFIKASCMSLRAKYSLKLPDSIIAATAHAYHLPLFTSDKSFAKLIEIKSSIYTF